MVALAPWLRARPVAVAPVFSNLPAPAHARQGDRDGAVSTVGLFGYAYGRADRLARARRAAPARRSWSGRARAAARRARALVGGGELWRSAAQDAGLGHPPSFSGTLEAQGLSDALAACDALLFVDPLGPTSRKTTLAASLSSGRPVIAVDGPRRWRELADAHAAEIVEPRADALAGALARLLEDRAGREALAARGRTFAEQSMSAARAAHTIAGLLRDVAS